MKPRKLITTGRNGFTRRDFIRTGSLAFGGLTIGNLCIGGIAPTNNGAKAKSVVFVWLQGGPSHIDTFDPKPKAGKDFYGPYRKALATNVDDVWIGQKMEQLGRVADKFSLIRGMTHGQFGHETATYVTLTGTSPNSQLVYPAMTAVIAYKKQNEYKGSLPANISLTTPIVRFSESGFLGPAFSSFATGGDPGKSDFRVEGIENKYVSGQRLKGRKELLQQLDKFEESIETSDEGRAMENFRQQNYSLLMGGAKKAFDLNEEKEKVKEKYGKNSFGQSCLLARRLVEQGVPVITVRDMGWDTHKQHFEKMDVKLPVLDKGLSALISDLDERGLLDETIIVCGGEFGRTPRILWEPPWYGGRGHYGSAFTYLVAGGGFKGGTVVGSTDNRAERVIERPVYPWELSATLYHLMGIDPYGQLPHPQDGMAYLLPDLGRNDKNNGMLTEIMKHV